MRLLAALLLALSLTGHAHGQAIGQSQSVFPAVVANANVTGSVASITNQTLLASTPPSPPSQYYRLSVYMECTTAGTGTNLLTLTRVDDILGSLTATYIPSLACTANNLDRNVRTIRVAPSSAITFSTTYAATGTWAIAVTLERLY